ncbi:MAG: hypothetical protein K1X89_05545 [Myxococcaceae bacterium]|nr:hypothetical protein [Myxococcaceae bacterium]
MSARRQLSTVGGGMAAVLASALLACGGSPKAPDLITRDLPAGEVGPNVTKVMPTDPLAAGGGFLDAGCCVVRFALPHETDQVDARLVLPTGKYPMDDFDAGYWSGIACLPPSANYFYFEVGYPTDDLDSGTLLYVERVNDALPVQTGTPYADQVNVFEAPDGGVCGGIDAAKYLSLPDAG